MSGVKLVSGSRPLPSVAATLYLFPLKHGQNIEGAVWYKLVLFYVCLFLKRGRCSVFSFATPVSATKRGRRCYFFFKFEQTPLAIKFMSFTMAELVEIKVDIVNADF